MENWGEKRREKENNQAVKKKKKPSWNVLTTLLQGETASNVAFCCSFYFPWVTSSLRRICPVGKSLYFLLERGWLIFECTRKNKRAVL